jgi:dUTP pyrophosphatase
MPVRVAVVIRSLLNPSEPEELRTDALCEIEKPLDPASRPAAAAVSPSVGAMIDALTDTLEIRLLHPDAVPPSRSRSGDAGYDLRATDRVSIPQDGRRLVGTGIAVALPEGVAGLVTPRSGLAIEHGLTLLNAPGLIDPNYRGEIKVILHNTSERRYTVEIGDRIAQLLLVPYWAPELEVVEALPESERGAGGFGSSGR